MDPLQLEALKIVAEENYAHARDHEQLRAQVTALLVAAAFVLIGLAYAKDAEATTIRYAAGMAISIGVLNVGAVLIHNNRFDRHVQIARNARNLIFQLEDFKPSLEKRGSLSAVWVAIAALPIFGGCVLLAVRGGLC